MVKNILPYLKSGRLLVLEELFAFFGHSQTVYNPLSLKVLGRTETWNQAEFGVKCHLCCFLSPIFVICRIRTRIPIFLEYCKI